MLYENLRKYSRFVPLNQGQMPDHGKIQQVALCMRTPCGTRVGSLLECCFRSSVSLFRNREYVPLLCTLLRLKKLVCNFQHPFSIPPYGLERHKQFSSHQVKRLSTKIIHKLCADTARSVQHSASKYAEKYHQAQLLLFHLFALIAFQCHLRLSQSGSLGIRY